jgi:hypothetical protein
MGGVTGYDPTGRNPELDAFLLTLVKAEAEKHGVRVMPAQAGNAISFYLLNGEGVLVSSGDIFAYPVQTQIGAGSEVWRVTFRNLFEDGDRLYEISSIYGEHRESVVGVEGLRDIDRIKQWVQNTLAPALPQSEAKPERRLPWWERAYNYIFRPGQPEWQ